MAIIEFLFETRTGMFVLIFGGMVIFALIAFFLERKTHRVYFNRGKSDDDDSWFSDDEEDEE